ncbi:membrane protein [Amycolatopsis mediterranei S699]|uniref:Predicted membrane protein n=2 Tax=Amycolatopsis mediterranei TaxID=33910 RepID=A0A0H3CVZ4_AMYMU|nr:PH domain-containing protein [Amycolatopsis mediterranei]ADJ42792.1 predicted membrane protein [Amycolatopsis mediterranei U32]AEK39484.1 membrane protein [Amycolatopsis mediterranei S699]AFO74506.1 membrane protein [Amycolatopsis mediterranei S699]AGT81635.1 membrane protein [Amycolatopsis mediterranei RB]KDO09908.1 membrane protein [Amycolatopsis mediterranei]
MAYPDDLLSEQEHVVVHSHPHFKMLIFPTLALLVTVGAGTWLAILAKDAGSPWNTVGLIAIGVVALVLVVWLFLAPLVRWRTTHFIVTTDRLIAREGVLKRTGIDIPMGRINSVQFEHGLLDRVFGCGTLIIESASDEPLRFEDIPHVEKVHTVIYREVNDNPYDDYRPGAPQQPQQTTPLPPQGGGRPPRGERRR